MLTMARPACIKAAGDQDGMKDGQFDALVSVFDTVDSYGDVVMPGAFADTLAEWEASGNPIPVWWSHQMSDPDFNVGHVLDAVETETGLRVRAQLDLDNAKAAQVYRLLKSRRVTQFSFTYDILDGGWGDLDGAEVYELRRLKLYELGPTPIGANQDTDLLAVKTASQQLAQLARLARGVKAGRVLSARNETTLRVARDQLALAVDRIDDVLSALAPTEDADEPDQPEESEETAEPDEAVTPGSLEDAAVAEPGTDTSADKGVSPATVRLLADLTDLDLLAA